MKGFIGRLRRMFEVCVGIVAFVLGAILLTFSIPFWPLEWLFCGKLYILRLADKIMEWSHEVCIQCKNERNSPRQDGYSV
jgi:hypothetical protein